MKKSIISITLCCMLLPTFAQGTIDVDKFKREIDTKANTLCRYIVAVGTSVGQPGSVHNAEKDLIIKNKVPSLFWNYREDPRYMKTTNGANGAVIRKRPMYIYFPNLKMQSENRLNTKTIYELRYEGIVHKNKSDNLTFERTLSDGCKLYSTIIRIRQRYHEINFSAKGVEGMSVEKTEEDIKDYKIYIVVKPNGKAGVFLGDVYRAKRV